MRSAFYNTCRLRRPRLLILWFWLLTGTSVLCPQTVLANSAPVALSLDHSEVAENQPAGTAVGRLSSTDPDPGDTHSYSLVPGPGSDDNAIFAIGGIGNDELQTGIIIDVNAGGTYSVRVRSTDTGSGNLFVEQRFTIYVTHQITVAWNSSFSPAVVGYEICYGTEPGKYDSFHDAGDKTEDVISGLKAETLYFMAIRAYDSNGSKSDYSEEITYKKSSSGTPGKISGTVYRFSGPVSDIPVVDLPVCAIDSNSGFWAGCARTQANGSYEIGVLPAGSYIVRAVAEETEFLAEYFPDAVDQSAAGIITIGLGESRTGINFVLNQGAAISGAFSYDGDLPLDNPLVYAEDSGTKFVYEGVTQPDGSYMVGGLPAGSYRLRAETLDSGYIREYYNNADDYGGSQLVATSVAQAASDIDFELAIGGSINGNVIRNLDDQPIEGLWVNAYHEDSGKWAGKGRTGADGIYTITGLSAGNYHVWVETGDTDYLDAYYDGTSESSSATPVFVNIEEVATNIDFNLVAGGRITGRVTRVSDSAPLAGIEVVAYEYSTGAQVDSALTRSDGTYTIARLLTGSYGVHVETGDTVYLDQHYENTYDSGSAREIVVTVQEETPNINFELVEGGRITGVVRREADDQPLPDIRVNAYDYGSGEWRASSLTLADGSYIIAKLRSGNYRVLAETDHNNVYGEYFDNAYRDYLASPVAVDLAQSTASIDFLLTEFSGTDTDGDRLTDSDETDIYHTNIYSADTDSDGIDDSDELDFWGEDWDEDLDGDGSHNLVDYDSDGDGWRDGYEDQRGSDPANPISVPAGVIAGTVFDNSAPNDHLFGVIDLADGMVYGTNSTATNIHSHYSGTELDATPGFVYRGRVRISAGSGGVGVTFLSQYPLSDTYYRLRRYGSNDFHLSPHGATVAGNTNTGVVPAANTWYIFKIEVQDTGSRTEIRAKVWPEAAAEPVDWQANAFDDSPTRLTTGKVGVWSYAAGSKYWDDLNVESLDPSNTLYAADFNSYPAGSAPANWLNTGADNSLEIEIVNEIPLSGTNLYVELYAGDHCSAAQFIQRTGINTDTGTYLFEGLDPAAGPFYLKTERNTFDYLDVWWAADKSSPFCQDAGPIDISSMGRNGVDFRVDRDEYPVAGDDAAFTAEDAATAPIQILGNDTDADGSIDPGTVTFRVPPAHGSAAADAGGNVVYTPGLNFNGIDYFTYTVRDNLGAISEEATVTVNVEPVNDAPSISGTPVSRVYEDAAYSFTPNADDIDGDSLTFSIINRPAWAIFNPFTGTLSGTPAKADVGITGDIRISVTDGSASASLAAFDLEVVNVSFDGDGDGMPDVWEQSNGLDLAADDVALDPDGDGYTNLEEYVYGTRPNDPESKPLPPAADAGPDQTVSEGDTVTLDGSNSSDPDNDIEAYYWRYLGDEPVILSNPDAVQPTFTTPQVGPGGASYAFELTVTDRSGHEDTDTCIINVTWDNNPPAADAGEDQTLGEGVTVILDGSRSSDLDDGIHSFRWTQTTGIQVILNDATSVQPTFTSPFIAADGIYLEFELRVTDNNGLVSTDTCIVNVSWINDAPTADAGLDQIVAEGGTVTLDGSDSADPDDGIEHYIWTQTAGTPVTLSDSRAMRPTFVTPPVDSNGERLKFLLAVIDGGGLAHTGTASVDVQDNGIDVFPDGAIPTVSVTGENIAIEIVEEEGAERGGHLVSFTTMSPEEVPDISATDTIPINLIYGLVDMAIKVDEPGAEIRVTVHLDAPAPVGYSWFKYTSKDGWMDFSDHAEFNPARTQVTITLVDGGIGDDDEAANGMIVDPSGLGQTAQSVTTGNSDSGGGGGGGCFISSAGDTGSSRLMTVLGAVSAFGLLGLTPWLMRQRIIHRRRAH